MSKRLPEAGPFWLSYRLRDVANKLADLLAWGQYPDPASMTDGWLSATKEGISTAVLLATEAGPPADLLAKLKKAKRLAFELATLMRENPDLSARPVTGWTMAGHRQKWDDLDALASEFDAEADKLDGKPGESKAGPTQPDPTPAPPAAPTPAEPSKSDAGAKPTGKRATVNARMIDILGKEPGSDGWTAREWANRLGCSDVAIIKTNTWKSFRLEREKRKAENALERARQKRRK